MQGETIEQVPVDLEPKPDDRVRQRADGWIEVAQTRAGLPIECRQGTGEDEIQVLVHAVNSMGDRVGRMFEVKVSDLRAALDFVEVSGR